MSNDNYRNDPVNRKQKSHQQLKATSKYFYEIIKGVPTDHLFSVDVDGKRIWTPERGKLHNIIISSTLKNAVPSEKPLAIFMGGGSASGKSRIRDEIVIPWCEEPVIIIDFDIIKSKLPEYAVYAEVDNLRGASLVHQESKDVALRLFEICLTNKYSFIYDSTMAAHPDFFIDLINRCRDNNYRLIIVGVYTPINIAINRKESDLRRPTEK